MREDTSREFSVRAYLGALRRHWLLVLLVTAVAVGIALAYSLNEQPTYRANAVLRFKPQPGTSLQETNAATAANEASITAPSVVRKVQRKIGGSLTSARDAVDTSASSSTGLVTIEASAPSGRRAATVANAFARETQRAETARRQQGFEDAANELDERLEASPRVIQEVYAERISELTESANAAAGDVTIMRLAQVPTAPASPRPVSNSALALVLGLIIGSIAAFVRDWGDRRVIDPPELQELLALRVVGSLRLEALDRAQLPGEGPSRPSPEDLEAFRILRSNADYLDGTGRLRLIAITGPVGDEGKSTAAAGLALASAMTGKRTLLLECDLRRPSQAERLGVEPEPGLVDYLVGEAELRDAVRVASFEPSTRGAQSPGDDTEPGTAGRRGAVGKSEFPCIVVGSPSPQAVDLLGSERLRELLVSLRGEYELVVLDCAPLLPVGDALQLVPQVDAVLLCVRIGQTTREQAASAKSTLERFPPRATGLVMTGVKVADGFGYQSSYDVRTPAD